MTFEIRGASRGCCGDSWTPHWLERNWRGSPQAHKGSADAAGADGADGPEAAEAAEEYGRSLAAGYASAKPDYEEDPEWAASKLTYDAVKAAI